MDDPRDVWLSRHFRLSDFLGNHSVYARGYANRYEDSQGIKARNARALCNHALEPLVERFGPVSIAYGYISPAFSRKTITYQDPDKPSHHRWDLGAAADVISHKWVQGLPMEPALSQLFANEYTSTSPALLAHAIDEELEVPYSRILTYSESPCVCIAVSERELVFNKPRKAFYENRYPGRAKAKPNYIQMPSAAQRNRNHAYLQETGLAHDWEGGGFPSYHGGGIRQYQHVRVSKYTTVLDWLFNLNSISNGVQNVPALLNGKVQDAFAAAGIIYDTLLERNHLGRLSILGGYLNPRHPDFDPLNDWRGGSITVEIGAPQEGQEWIEIAAHATLPGYVEVRNSPRGVYLTFDVEQVLDSPELI